LQDIWREADNRLFSPNLKQYLTAGSSLVSYNQFFMYLAYTHRLHAGGDRGITKNAEIMTRHEARQRLVC